MTAAQRFQNAGEKRWRRFEEWRIHNEEWRKHGLAGHSKIGCSLAASRIEQYTFYCRRRTIKLDKKIHKCRSSHSLSFQIPGALEDVQWEVSDLWLHTMCVSGYLNQCTIHFLFDILLGIILFSIIFIFLSQFFPWQHFLHPFKCA